MVKQCSACQYSMRSCSDEPCVGCFNYSLWRRGELREVSYNDYPSNKQDQGKPDMRMLRHLKHSLIAIVGIMQAGAIKYEEGGFVNVPDGLKRYDSALIRHWLEDPASPVDDMQEYADQLGVEITHDMAVAINALFKLEIRLREKVSNED